MIGRNNIFYSKSGFLNFFRQKKEESSDQMRLDWRIRCPRCNIEMRKVSRMGVTIDICDRCGGMWLDKGEMDSLNRMNVDDGLKGDLASVGLARPGKHKAKPSKVKPAKKKRK